MDEPVFMQNSFRCGRVLESPSDVSNSCLRNCRSVLSVVVIKCLMYHIGRWQFLMTLNVWHWQGSIALTVYWKCSAYFFGNLLFLRWQGFASWTGCLLMHWTQQCMTGLGWHSYGVLVAAYQITSVWFFLSWLIRSLLGERSKLLKWKISIFCAHNAT